MAEAENGQQVNEEVTWPSSEPRTHSFVVKIWLEETADETQHPVWRGHITHVASGQRRYVNSLAGISGYIAPYLAGWQIKLPLRERICLWWNRRK
jgi:hypothetical protein